MSVVIPLAHDPHASVQAVLPWYARGQLGDDEMQEVQEHLLRCAECRADLAAERPLQTLLSLPEAAPDSGGVESGLRQMRSRLDADAQAGRRTPRPVWWMGWGLGLQSVAVVLLLVLLMQSRSQMPAYLGMAAPSAPASAGAEALIMFKAEASEHSVRKLLQANGASIVGGPTESGAYLLRLSDSAQALPRLRADPIVNLVESLEPGVRR